MPVYILSAEQFAKNQETSVYWVIAVVALTLAAFVGYIVCNKKKKR